MQKNELALFFLCKNMKLCWWENFYSEQNKHFKPCACRGKKEALQKAHDIIYILLLKNLEFLCEYLILYFHRLHTYFLPHFYPDVFHWYLLISHFEVRAGDVDRRAPLARRASLHCCWRYHHNCYWESAWFTDHLHILNNKEQNINLRYCIKNNVRVNKENRIAFVLWLCKTGRWGNYLLYLLVGAQCKAQAIKKTVAFLF